MNDNTRTYKYSCRTCHIRQRCIDHKGFGPSLKNSIARRFENRTDTFETWDMLQQSCLLAHYERLRSAQPHDTATGLSKRLNRKRQPPSQVNAAPTAFSKLHQPPKTNTPPWMAVQPPKPTTPATVAHDGPSQGIACGLRVTSSQRTVRLPEYGEVVLGRFEHGLSNPPDVDLAHDDGLIPSVSRRHAVVIARGNAHWIEDMGSSNGTYVNGNPVPVGSRRELVPNDRLLLGRCRLVHAPLPDWVLNPDSSLPHEAYLLITHTGDRVPIPRKSDVTVGRPDPMLGFTPDINLGHIGDISIYVSRRHIRLIQRGGLHFLEEIGSAGGTRLNGKPVQTGASPELLHPGDQLWLGGCVLAYEWELI